MKKFLLLLLISTCALAASPMIWRSGTHGKLLSRTGFYLNDNKEYRSLEVDPRLAAGVAAEVGSVGVRDNAGLGEIYFKIGAADTGWVDVLTGGTAWGLFGNAATTPGTGVGQNYIGTSDAVDFIMATNDTERFRLTAAGAYDTTFGAGILHSDASGILSSSAVDLASADVTGILPLANGGTNKNATASNGAVVYSDADSFELSAVGSSNQVLQSNGAAAPTWSTATYPPTTTINQLLYSSAANTVSGLATANTSALITGGTGIPAWTAAAVDGSVLRRSGGAIAFGSIDLADSDTVGVSVLPIANGGTNSSTALNDDRIMISSGGAIVESGAIAATSVLYADANGLPVGDSGLVYNDGTQILTAENAQINTDLFFKENAGVDLITVSAPAIAASYSLTLPVNDGAANQFLQTDGSGGLSWQGVDLATDVTGVLPIANGGTNSSTALNNNRFMTSSGGALVEAAAIASGLFVYTDTNGLPTGEAALAYNATTNVGTIDTLRAEVATQYGDTGGGTNYVTIQAPTNASLTADYTLTLPTNDGDANQFLITDGSGSLSFDTVPYFFAYLGSSQNVTNSVLTKLNMDTETFDNKGWYDAATNYRYTPQRAGKYTCGLHTFGSGFDNRGELYIYKNGSGGTVIARGDHSTGDMGGTATGFADMNGSTDYLEAFVYHYSTASKTYSQGQGVTYYFCTWVGP